MKTPFLKRTQSGFTLIELLVVMVLLGLMSLALFGGLRFGARAWETAQSRSVDLSEIEMVQSLLRRQVAEAAQPEFTFDNSGPPAFRGNENILSLMTRYPNHRRVGGINFFRLKVIDRGDEGLALRLQWRLYNADGSEHRDGEGRETRILLRGLETARFSYFGRRLEDRESAWHETWSKDDPLPELIRLSAAFPEDDPRYWPELIVAPMAPIAGR